MRAPLALGWDDRWADACAAVAASASSASSASAPAVVLHAVRVVAEHRGAYHAAGEDGVAWCELRGRAFHRARDKRALPTVGDWLVVADWARARAGGGAASIVGIAARRGLLVRRAAGVATAPQPIAANVDVGVVLTSATGDLSPARLDRYLGLLRDGGIAPVVALSKCDLAADPAALLATLEALGPSVPRVALSCVTGHGVDALRALVGPGRTGILLGSSGVGKSTLLNQLLEADVQATGEVRGDDRGKHTTTRRELFAAATGGLWIDTPGMRELALWSDGGPDEPAAFDDVDALAARCRFRDCRHEAEPGCAAQAAVTAGTLDAGRLASFRKLAAERGAGARRGRARRGPAA